MVLNNGSTAVFRRDIGKSRSQYRDVREMRIVATFIIPPGVPALRKATPSCPMLRVQKLHLLAITRCSTNQCPLI